MDKQLNHLNQPVGHPVYGWKPPQHPAGETLQGRFCRLEPIDPVRHAASLYQANALDVEGRNRDTAWYAAIDQEWPELKMAFEQWLDPLNFDEQGRQRAPLSALTAPVLKQRG